MVFEDEYSDDSSFINFIALGIILTVFLLILVQYVMFYIVAIIAGVALGFLGFGVYKKMQKIAEEKIAVMKKAEELESLIDSIRESSSALVRMQVYTKIFALDPKNRKTILLMIANGDLHMLRKLDKETIPIALDILEQQKFSEDELISVLEIKKDLYSEIKDYEKKQEAQDSLLKLKVKKMFDESKKNEDKFKSKSQIIRRYKPGKRQ